MARKHEMDELTGEVSGIHLFYQFFISFGKISQKTGKFGEFRHLETPF
jgi:hypothetical protein